MGFHLHQKYASSTVATASCLIHLASCHFTISTTIDLGYCLLPEACKPSTHHFKICFSVGSSPAFHSNFSAFHPGLVDSYYNRVVIEATRHEHVRGSSCFCCCSGFGFGSHYVRGLRSAYQLRSCECQAAEELASTGFGPCLEVHPVL